MGESPRQVALITGAGSGIGRATALMLARAGYQLMLAGRTKEKLQQTAQQIAGVSPQTATDVFALDLTDSAACRGAVGTTINAYGRLDALVNVAGYASMVAIRDITPQEWQLTVDANLSSVMYLTAAAWPVFEKQGGGLVVNVSSMAGTHPFPDFSLYAPAKAGLNMFTRMIALQGEKAGIKAVGIAPGAVDTPMLRALWDTTVLPPEKCLQPEEVAALIRDCVMGTRPFENGETIPIAKDMAKNG